MISKLYFPVPFPLSQYFLEEKHLAYIILINNEAGVKEWGSSAYLVPGWLLFQKQKERPGDFAEYFENHFKEEISIIDFDDPRKSQSDPFLPNHHLSGLPWKDMPGKDQLS